MLSLGGHRGSFSQRQMWFKSEHRSAVDRGALFLLNGMGNKPDLTVSMDADEEKHILSEKAEMLLRSCCLSKHSRMIHVKEMLCRVSEQFTRCFFIGIPVKVWTEWSRSTEAESNMNFLFMEYQHYQDVMADEDGYDYEDDE